MRKSFLLGMAIFVLTLATQPSFADTIAYSPSSIVNACFEVNALNIPEDISTDAGRSESEADKPNGLKWAGAIDQFAPGTGLQELFAQRGIEKVFLFRSSYTLFQAIDSLSTEDRQKALTFIGAGRLPFQQLLLLPKNSQIASRRQTRIDRADQIIANPEPASLLLLGTGLSAIAYTLRKRTKK